MGSSFRAEKHTGADIAEIQNTRGGVKNVRPVAAVRILRSSRPVEARPVIEARPATSEKK